MQRVISLMLHKSVVATLVGRQTRICMSNFVPTLSDCMTTHMHIVL